MRLAAVALALALLAAGCGGSSSGNEEPKNAYLTAVKVEGSSVRFEFDNRPADVRAAYEPRARVAECGSGRPVRLKGTAFAVVHFRPAASARIDGEKVVPTYTGPRRLAGPGPVLELVKSCDFEADLGWAIGVASRLALHVSRDGSAVTVSFG